MGVGIGGNGVGVGVKTMIAGVAVAVGNGVTVGCDVAVGGSGVADGGNGVWVGATVTFTGESVAVCGSVAGAIGVAVAREPSVSVGVAAPADCGIAPIRAKKTAPATVNSTTSSTAMAVSHFPLFDLAVGC